MPSTSRGYPYPTLSDAPNTPQHLQSLAQAVNGDVTAVVAQLLAAVAQARGQRGAASVSFTNQSTYVHHVNFPTPFASKPHVDVHITSGASPTARWTVRPINIDVNGFDAFAFHPAGTAATWSGVEVIWKATE